MRVIIGFFVALKDIKTNLALLKFDFFVIKIVWG